MPGNADIAATGLAPFQTCIAPAPPPTCLPCNQPKMQNTTFVVPYKGANCYLAAMAQQKPAIPNDEMPPILGSWRNIYAFVLVLHFLLIVAFYLFSAAHA